MTLKLKQKSIHMRDRSLSHEDVIVVGDLHATYVRPKNRIDDYWETFKDKFEFIMKEGYKTSLGIIQVGDFFNSFNTPKWAIAELEELILEKNSHIYTIYGQHDMKYHSTDISDTSLNVISQAGLVNILGAMPVAFTSRGIHIYGASWGEPIPFFLEPTMFNILVIHKMVVEKKLWTDQKDFTYATELEKLGFSLILSGDNHQKFVQGRVINAGSVTRITSAQTGHIPAIFKVRIWPDKYYEVEEIPIPIKPASEVFDLEKIDKEKVKSVEMEQFASGLDTEFDFSDNGFWDTVEQISNENPLDKDTKGILEEVKNGF
jgi:hypothetical protein